MSVSDKKRKYRVQGLLHTASCHQEKHLQVHEDEVLQSTLISVAFMKPIYKIDEFNIEILQDLYFIAVLEDAGSLSL